MLITVQSIGAFKVPLNRINSRSRNTTRMHNHIQKFVHNVYQRNSARMYLLSRPLPLASAKSRNGVSTFVGIVSLFCKPSRARIVSNGLLDFTERRRAKIQVTADANVCVRLFTIPENAPFSLSLWLSLSLSCSRSLFVIVSRSSLRLFGTPLKSQMLLLILRLRSRCHS